MLISLFVVIAIFVIAFHKEPKEQSKRRKPITGFGSTDGSVFFSVDMRCPKCRADMEQVDVGGIEIDRCKYCQGIWFDAGEREALQAMDVAAEIDTGDAKRGKEANQVDDYPCPRCSGAMVRVVDPQQTHIWFEVCSSCSGSFFDAGEFTDLTTHSLSDFFKRWSTPERK